MVFSEDEMRLEITKIRDEVLEKDLDDENGDRSIRMKGSTLKNRLDIGAMISKTIEKIKRISDEQDLDITVKSGIPFGDHKDEDWIVFTHNPVPTPAPEWFDEMLARDYESEREVETYFIVPMLEKLGYDYDDIVIDYSIEVMKGSRKEKPKHPDFVLFNGPGRNENDVLLIIEAKNSDKDITPYAIGQAKYYAKELLPACYIVTNGEMISVFAFNGLRTQDSQILNFNRSMLKDVWKDFYRCVGKKATLKAKFRNAQGS
jgi:hypothetical protein